MLSGSLNCNVISPFCDSANSVGALGNNIEGGKAVICRYSIMPECEKNGLQPLVPLEKYVPADPRNWIHWSNWCVAGAMKVTYIPDDLWSLNPLSEPRTIRSRTGCCRN